MSKVEEIISSYSAKLLANPAALQGVEGSCKIVVEGVGTWVFCCGAKPSVKSGEAPADCTISLAAEDFIAMASKELNPQVAYMLGKIQVSGDFNVALGFSELFAG
jgi:putative sterol carrier protein